MVAYRCMFAHGVRNSTVPDTSHRNGIPPEGNGLTSIELHTAESRRVTVQEGFGNGYIRSKLLPLVDRMT